MYYNCGTCGYKSRTGTVTIGTKRIRTTKECKGSGTEVYWTYNDWGNWSDTGASSCQNLGAETQCTELTQTTSKSCTEDCTLEQSCGCGGKQTKAGTKSGTKTRTATCKGDNGTSGSSAQQRYYSYSQFGECGNFGECTSSASWGTCSKSDCPSGYHCNGSGSCVADCSDTCPNGYTKGNTPSDDNCYDTSTTGCGSNCYKKNSKIKCSGRCYDSTFESVDPCNCGGQRPVTVSVACVNGEMKTMGVVSYGECSSSLVCSSTQICCSGSCYTKTSTNVNRGSCANGRGTYYCTVTRSCNSSGTITTTESDCKCKCNSTSTCSGDKSWSNTTCQCDYVYCNYAAYGAQGVCGQCAGLLDECRRLDNQYQTACAGNPQCMGNNSEFQSRVCSYCGTDNRCHRSRHSYNPVTVKVNFPKCTD